MERARLREFHYIVAIENLASIVEHGILSHVRASRLREARGAEGRSFSGAAGRRRPSRRGGSGRRWPLAQAYAQRDTGSAMIGQPWPAVSRLNELGGESKQLVVVAVLAALDVRSRSSSPRKSFQGKARPIDRWWPQIAAAPARPSASCRVWAAMWLRNARSEQRVYALIASLPSRARRRRT
jgi:hypothetical protein